MRTLRTATGVILACLAAAGCGGDGADSEATASTAREAATSSSASESRSEVEHTFDGRRYTCEEALDISVGCNDEIVEVWEKWGENLPDYVSSGQLGPLNDAAYRVEDVAFAGVLACIVSENGGDEQDFIDLVQDPENRTGLEDLDGTELLPAWFEAGSSLCPNLTTSDYTVP